MTTKEKKLARILRRAGKTVRRADLTSGGVFKKGEDTANLVTVYDKAVQEYLKAAESTAMRLKKLSDDMFGYFLVFGGKELEINMESYDAATLIDQMLFEHITLMRESGYNVAFDGCKFLLQTPSSASDANGKVETAIGGVLSSSGDTVKFIKGEIFSLGFLSFKLIKVVVDIFLEIALFVGYSKECSECTPISSCGVLRKRESFTLDAFGCAQVFSELVAEINC